MGLLDSERLAFLKRLRPASVKRLASLRMEDVVGLEAKRARTRVSRRAQAGILGERGSAFAGGVFNV